MAYHRQRRVGYGEALRFILVNLWLRGSTMRSSWQACNFCYERCHSRGKKTTTLSVRLKIRKSSTRRWLTSSSLEASRTQRPRFKRQSRQPTTSKPINSMARPPMGTPSTATRSSGLARGEIRTTKPKEATWSGVAIGKRSIPSVSTQRSTCLW
jgi:hypothetical protein